MPPIEAKISTLNMDEYVSVTNGTKEYQYGDLRVTLISSKDEEKIILKHDLEKEEEITTIKPGETIKISDNFIEKCRQKPIEISLTSK